MHSGQALSILSPFAHPHFAPNSSLLFRRMFTLLFSHTLKAFSDQRL